MSDKAFALIRFAEWLDRGQREGRDIHRDLWRCGLRDTAGHVTELTDRLAKHERALLRSFTPPTSESDE